MKKENVIFLPLIVAFGLGLLGILIGLFIYQVNNPHPPDKVPSLIIEQDGVKVYRYYDGQRDIYFTTPDGDVEWQELVGKTMQDRKTTGGKRK